MINCSKMSKGPEICDVEEFMGCPLVTWFRSCLDSVDKENFTYEELVDGVLIHQVFLQMGLESVDEDVTPSQEEPRKRARNLRAILANLRQFYEERGDVVVRVPQVGRLAREPRLHVLEAELLLCLLLGCAVQCPRNEEFIERIKGLEVPIQQAIAECIKQVVHVPNIVLSADMLSGPAKELEVEASAALENVRRVYRERSRYLEQLRALAREDAGRGLDDEELELQEVLELLSSRHRDTELDECRARVRRQRDELKKTQDELYECREELRQCKLGMTAVKKENEILEKQARNAEMYRDELDAAKESAEKASQLEQEIKRYKERLADAEDLKGQLSQVQEMNVLLIDHNQMLTKNIGRLEEKLGEFEAEAAGVPALKKQLAEAQQCREELEHEAELARERQRELLDENAELSRRAAAKDDVEPDEPPGGPMNASLSEQLSTSAQSQALRLQLENHRLATLVDSLQASPGRGAAPQLRELERENRLLATTLDSVRDDPVLSNPEIARERQRRLGLGRALAESRAAVGRLEAEKRAALDRAASLERELEEARAARTVRRRSPVGREHAQLREDFGLLFREHQRLLQRLAALDRELAGRRECAADCQERLEQLRQRCADLVSEKRFLLEHSNQLSQQNCTLVSQMMEASAQYYAEDRKIREEMTNLSRHKEKLEEKIMDQFRRMPSSAGKKRSSGASLVKKTLSKMRRASSGLFSRTRGSWAEESSERCLEFDYTRGHESDGPAGGGKPRNRKSVDFLDNFRPSDFSFQVNLEQERSHRSVDLMDIPCFEEPERPEEEDAELNRTLRPAEAEDGAADLSSFANSKSVDLSLEDLLEEKENVEPDGGEDEIERMFRNCRGLKKARSRKSLWTEQGCA